MASRIRIGAHEISYEEYGSGPTLVLLHGFGGTPMDWETVGRGLASHHRVVIPRLNSLFFNPNHPLTFSEQAEIVAQFLHRMKLFSPGQLDVGAVSYGAAVAYATSMLYPDLVSHLFLVSPMPPHPLKKIKDPVLRWLLKFSHSPSLLGVFLTTSLARLLLPRIERHFYVPWKTKVKGRRLFLLTTRQRKIIGLVLHRFATMGREANWEFWVEKAPHLTSPLEIIWGDADPLFSHEDFRSLQSLFKNSQGAVITQAGHFIMCENAEVVIQRLNRFLNKESNPVAPRELERIG